jgi:Tfp pilus assembly protein FimT
MARKPGVGHQRPVRLGCEGFSLLELVMVVLTVGILIGVAAPSVSTIARVYRLTGDARSITAQLNLARMRAASLATKSRLNVNLAANTYSIEVWNKATNVYQVESGPANLSQGNNFGFGNITAPAGLQTTIAEGYPGETGCGCVYFNSRGLVTDSAGNVTSNSALYISNGREYAAVALSITGQTTPFIRRGSVWGRL